MAVFAIVSFFIGQLGDGLNIFQGIYLVNLGWNEGSVGLALSLMGLSTLLVQTPAGDIVDKTTIDRRIFLAVAAVATALSASAVMFVQEGNNQHGLMYGTKVVEGIAASFIGPCLAALTLASFGPERFDAVMASNLLWGHNGSVAAAAAAGGAAYALYPTSYGIKFCFLVIGFSALMAIAFVGFLPRGDPLLARGFASQKNDHNIIDDDMVNNNGLINQSNAPVAVGYMEVFSERKTCVLCLTGFFFQ